MRHFLMAAALLAGAGVAAAAGKQAAAKPETDAALANSVRHEIVMYGKYSIWDDVGIEVSNGTVHLTGVVTQPYKKADMDRLARNVAGAAQVQDDIRVLPLSPNDDRLRLRIARANDQIRGRAAEADPHTGGKRARDAHRNSRQRVR